ncbi:KGK domain-containing protein [Mesoplasma melaleucae]|uniref:KGK domain-containing protein n=1 Tax=Mesoplasma melaleucae TaxID=81459 RepID=UPI0012FF2E89
MFLKVVDKNKAITFDNKIFKINPIKNGPHSTFVITFLCDSNNIAKTININVTIIFIIQLKHKIEPYNTFFETGVVSKFLTSLVSLQSASVKFKLYCEFLIDEIPIAEAKTKLSAKSPDSASCGLKATQHNIVTVVKTIPKIILIGSVI